jgi:hypothetical protein
MEMWLLFLFVVIYVISIDRNVVDYLYLTLFAKPLQDFQIFLLKNYLLIRLKYELYQIKRGHVSRKHMDMAKQLREETSESK